MTPVACACSFADPRICPVHGVLHDEFGNTGVLQDPPPVTRLPAVPSTPAEQAASILRRLVIAWDADQDLEVVELLAEARAYCGFVLATDGRKSA